MRPKEIDRIECAIRHIQSSLDVDPWAAEIAEEAMRKQIPIAPCKVKDEYTDVLYKLYCPVCDAPAGYGNSRVGYTVRHNVNGYVCSYCGQAIDWPEDEG